MRLPLAILYHVADHAEDEGGQWRLCNAAHKRGAKAERKAERACQEDQLREDAEHTAEQDGAALAEHTAHEWAQRDDHHNGYGLDQVEHTVHPGVIAEDILTVVGEHSAGDRHHSALQGQRMRTAQK